MNNSFIVIRDLRPPKTLCKPPYPRAHTCVLVSTGCSPTLIDRRVCPVVLRFLTRLKAVLIRRLIDQLCSGSSVHLVPVERSVCTRSSLSCPGTNRLATSVMFHLSCCPGLQANPYTFNCISYSSSHKTCCVKLRTHVLILG